MGLKLQRWLGHGLKVGLVTMGALPVGWSTAWSAEPTRTPTFTKDIAPIFQQKCESCHRADGMAPMSLATYEEARP